jgi:hypothetical protein
MKRFRFFALLGWSLLTLAGCGDSAAPPSLTAPATADAFSRLVAAQVRAEVRWAPEMTLFAHLPMPSDALPAIAPEGVALLVAAAREAELVAAQGWLQSLNACDAFLDSYAALI